jgi:uncharacterized membrane protein
MSLLRYVSLMALTVWVGGLTVLGAVAAPAIFGSLEGLNPATGRETAGRVFGEVFARFQHLAWILGGVIIMLLVARAALGPRPRRFAVRMAVVCLMVSLSLASALLIAPAVEAIRDRTPGPIAALPDGDGTKTTFGQLHGLSNGFALITILGGMWLIWFEVRDEH